MRVKDLEAFSQEQHGDVMEVNQSYLTVTEVTAHFMITIEMLECTVLVS